MSIKKPKEFKIMSFKRTSSGLISIGWVREDNDGKASVENRKLPIHKDFQTVLTKMESFLAQYYGINEDRVSLKSVSVVHYEDGKGESVQIAGNYTHVDSEQVTSIKTSKMQLHNEFYGFEGELKKTLTDLSKEACEYVFDNKSTQASLDLEKVA